MKSLKNNDNIRFNTQLIGYLLLLMCSSNVFTMAPRVMPEEYVTGDELIKVVKLLLASECIKGHCVCPAGRGQCKYLIAHNNYREKKANAVQLHNWREDQQKSM